MKVVIIEDEEPAANALEKIILELRPDTQILSSPGSVEEAVEWLDLHQAPDLIFSDIQLSDGNSFEIFKQVEVSCPVVFTTAYNEYAIQAFKVNSIDYLLKPIQKKEVSKAIKKYEDLQQHQLGRELGNLQNLLQQSGASTGRTERKTRFVAKSGQSLVSVPAGEVAYFLAEEGVVFLYNFEGKRFLVNYTLDELMEQLDENSFTRANRQLIVHIDAIKEVRPYFKGRLQLVLDPDPGEQFVVSSSKAPGFREWLDL